MKSARAILGSAVFFLLSASVLAQNPIHPVFEGFSPLANGSNALVFGYYNSSRQPIEIPPGAANSFSISRWMRSPESLASDGAQAAQAAKPFLSGAPLPYQA